MTGNLYGLARWLMLAIAAASLLSGGLAFAGGQSLIAAALLFAGFTMLLARDALDELARSALEVLPPLAEDARLPAAGALRDGPSTAKAVDSKTARLRARAAPQDEGGE